MTMKSPCASKSDQQSPLLLAILSTLQEASFIVAKLSKQQVPVLLWPPSVCWYLSKVIQLI